MISILFDHQWKSFWRSRGAGKSVALQIFMGFVTLYLLVCAIFAGFYLRHILNTLYPGQDIIFIFCGFILYFFLADLLVRFMMQNLPTLTIQPYLAQNIQRRQLIRFLNLRSMVTVINLFPLLLAVPFAVLVMAPKYGAAAVLAFVASLVGITFFNHFVILYVKRKSIINSWGYVVFFAGTSLLAAADYFHVFSLRHLSSVIFSHLLLHPWLLVLPLLLGLMAYLNNYRFLYKNLYLEDIVARNKKREGTDYAFLNRFGTVGDLIGLDIKLIMRNKRPRSTVMMTAVCLFYGFIMYKPQYIHAERWGFLIFGAFFITGLFIVTYGQFLFAWQSAHFDGLMAGNLNVKTYIKSKFVLFTAVSTLFLLLSSFYGFLSWKIILIQLAVYLYNIGIQTVITIYFATRSYQAIDIGRGTSFNYQGMGAEKWIFSLVVYLIPLFIFLPFYLFLNAWAGLFALAVTGVISLLLQDWWVEILSREFLKRKYKILDGFREK